MNCFIPPSLELFLAVPIVQVYGPIFPVLKVWHEYWTKHFLYYIKCVLHGWIPIFILCRENQEKYCYLNLMIKWFWWCSVHTLWKKKIYVVPFTLPLVASLTCFSHKHSVAGKGDFFKVRNRDGGFWVGGKQGNQCACPMSIYREN